MTGEEALREAARLESARVYGRLCRESTPVRKPVDGEGAKVIPIRKKGAA